MSRILIWLLPVVVALLALYVNVLGLWIATLLFLLAWGLLVLCIVPVRKSRMDASWQQFDYAHRGLHDGNQSIMENSMLAFQKAVEAGYGIELDVQCCKDEVVVIHDRDLKRSCGLDRPIEACTYQELQRYGLYGSEARIPTFAQVLKLVDGRVPLIVEIKQHDTSNKSSEAAARLLDDYHGAFCVESFNPHSVRWFKEQRPEWIRGQLSDFMKVTPSLNRRQAFAITHLLTNVWTQPDFVAYQVQKRHWVAPLITRYAMVPMVHWTIKTQHVYNQVAKTKALIIFEGFIPEKAKH